jgi:hypothetical protein
VAGISENDVRHSFLSGFVVNLGAYIGGMFSPKPDRDQNVIHPGIYCDNTGSCAWDYY